MSCGAWSVWDTPSEKVTRSSGAAPRSAGADAVPAILIRDSTDCRPPRISAWHETTKFWHVSHTQEAAIAVTASGARRDLARLIERVNLDRTAVEITSKNGSTVLLSKDKYDEL